MFSIFYFYSTNKTGLLCSFYSSVSVGSEHLVSSPPKGSLLQSSDTLAIRLTQTCSITAIFQLKICRRCFGIYRLDIQSLLEFYSQTCIFYIFSGFQIRSGTQKCKDLLHHTHLTGQKVETYSSHLSWITFYIHLLFIYVSFSILSTPQIEIIQGRCSAKQ